MRDYVMSAGDLYKANNTAAVLDPVIRTLTESAGSLAVPTDTSSRPALRGDASGAQKRVHFHGSGGQDGPELVAVRSPGTPPAGRGLVRGCPLVVDGNIAVRPGRWSF